MEINPVMVAMRDGEGEGESSEREEGVWREKLPKRRPSVFEGEERKRLMREERVGPEIVTFSNGRSSMEEERKGKEERERGEWRRSGRGERGQRAGSFFLKKILKCNQC